LAVLAGNVSIEQEEIFLRTTRILIMALAVLVLAACTSTPAPAPTVAPVAPTPSPVAAVLPTDAPTATAAPSATPTPTNTPLPTPTPLNPLSIEYLRERVYPGSDITIEQTLAPGSNYNRYIASYLSDGLKIYALLTVPRGAKPATGWPVIIFNHGYIPPAQYSTTERYVAYVDAFARSGYIVFKSDYRGHGNSEGQATGGYGSPDYTIDVLNALSSLKKYPDADPNRIGMWGHSMGGMVTLRAMVISTDIKAGVIWSGVVASYPDLMTKWHHPDSGAESFVPSGVNRGWRNPLIQEYGTPEENPAFWASISPNSYVSDLSGPLQLDATPTDPEVPFEFSQTLYNEVKSAGKTVEFYSYPNDDHNLSQHLTLALQRSVAFFDKYVKTIQQ
jgi:uncharacterized protein